MEQTSYCEKGAALAAAPLPTEPVRSASSPRLSTLRHKGLAGRAVRAGTRRAAGDE